MQFVHQVEDERKVLGKGVDDANRAFRFLVPANVLIELAAAKHTSAIMFCQGYHKDHVGTPGGPVNQGQGQRFGANPASRYSGRLC